MIAKIIKKSIQNLAHRFGYHILSKNCISGDLELLLLRFKKLDINIENILDIGAFNGDWSTYVSQFFPQASYFLMEPQQEMKDNLEHFFKSHKGKYFIAGAGAACSEAVFTVWPDFAGSSFLNSVSTDQSKEHRTLPIFSVDSLVEKKEIPYPNLCKIDVQGYEMEVLKGCESIFGKTDVFIVEVSFFEFSDGQPLAHDVINFMASKGYVLYDFAGFLNRPFDGALGQADLCFVKQNSKLRASKTW